MKSANQIFAKLSATQPSEDMSGVLAVHPYCFCVMSPWKVVVELYIFPDNLEDVFVCVVSAA